MKTLTLTVAALTTAALTSAALAAPASLKKPVSLKKAALSSPMTMGNMVTNLKGKNGASFDKEFLSEMLMHHQGAVSMAQLALVHAQHPQLKEEAKQIIASQTKEIIQMQKWQKEWGYVKP